MKSKRDLIEILNDLIRISHDPTEGYHKAEELKPTDIDLKTIFTNMANTSVYNIQTPWLRKCAIQAALLLLILLNQVNSTGFGWTSAQEFTRATGNRC